MEEDLIRLFILCFTIVALLVGGALSCEKKSGSFWVGALGLDEDRIILASQLATALTVSAYDLSGNFIARLADYQAEVNGPRGLAPFDSFHFILSLEGDDRLDMVYMGGGRSTYIQGSLFTGTIGKIVRHPTTLDYFVIENTNMIERFQITGDRIPVTGNPFVNGALAPCAAPASLRTLVINNSGQLLAFQSGAATGFNYTIGPTVASACAAVAAQATNVNDVINHSDGNMYWAGTNNQIYRASQTMTGSTSIFNSAATIAAPTAIAELPNGNLIIASDTTDSVEVITTSGTYVGSFAKDVNTQQVHSILVVEGQ
jgi:hypothetical protein